MQDNRKVELNFVMKLDPDKVYDSAMETVRRVEGTKVPEALRLGLAYLPSPFTNIQAFAVPVSIGINILTVAGMNKSLLKVKADSYTHLDQFPEFKRDAMKFRVVAFTLDQGVPPPLTYMKGRLEYTSKTSDFAFGLYSTHQGFLREQEEYRRVSGISEQSHREAFARELESHSLVVNHYINCLIADTKSVLGMDSMHNKRVPSAYTPGNPVVLSTGVPQR